MFVLVIVRGSFEGYFHAEKLLKYQLVQYMYTCANSLTLVGYV